MTAKINTNGHIPPLVRMTSAAQLYVYLLNDGIPNDVCDILKSCNIDGIAFSLLSEQDLREMNVNQIAVRKHVLYLSSCWRQQLGTQATPKQTDTSILAYFNGDSAQDHCQSEKSFGSRLDMNSQRLTESKHSVETLVELDPKRWKTIVSVVYAFLVAGITSFVMVLAHERLPDMSKFPPLPDLFLDNLPHIKWAFHAAEGVGVILASMWLIILIFHRYRMILLRRFFALIGTVFLLRSITMIITSLSVPGLHLTEHCSPYNFTSSSERMHRILEIWLGFGMSIRGIQTCGDYMFSGHTICLTLFNFFITEYAPSRLQWVHTFSWVLNLFGIFFILASHEHYSIDVFVAVYISSRLFLYYHCLANNRILHQNDKNRTMIWFPLFSFFEYDVCGMVPNVYELPFEKEVFSQIFYGFLSKCKPAGLVSNYPCQESSSCVNPHDDTQEVRKRESGIVSGYKEDESQHTIPKEKPNTTASQQ